MQTSDDRRGAAAQRVLKTAQRAILVVIDHHGTAVETCFGQRAAAHFGAALFNLQPKLGSQAIAKRREDAFAALKKQRGCGFEPAKKRQLGL